ncbi:baseplate J/gp47 family protein [Paenibacillus sp. SAF-054]|uniref:baseplate J/gp47 family protein n=1 Tax=unclassified Paenibacillus TaxID=185978 RepID=UPI003F810A84
MLTEKGFQRKRFEDLFAEAEDKAKEVFGEKVNTSERSFLGILLRLFAWFMAKLWGLAEDVYNSGYIPTATGNNLDRLGPNVGITRVLDQYAAGYVILTGTPAHTETAGFRVGTETGIIYEALEDFTFGPDGKASVKVEALEPGQSGNIAAGMITVIVNPNPDVTAVTNPERITGGREKETDPEFRSRYELSVAGGGSASVDAIRGALLRLDKVRAAAVIENNTMQPDTDGRPPKSIQVYVLGGDDQEVAETIFTKQSGGIETYGDISKEVLDLGGYPHIIKFSHAEEVPIFANIEVIKNDRYPANGDELIRNAIIRYIGGEDAAGSYYNGLSMGGSVVYTRLISAVYSVDGVEDVALTVGSSVETMLGQNVQIAPYQVAQTTAGHIEVLSHV